MARALYDAGTRCREAERAWNAALYDLHFIVTAAKDTGIPKSDVTALVSGRRIMGGGTLTQLRAIIRKIYG